MALFDPKIGPQLNSVERVGVVMGRPEEAGWSGQRKVEKNRRKRTETMLTISERVCEDPGSVPGPVR